MSDPVRIGPKEAAEKMATGYTYVDVRTEEEFAAGHPAGAVNVPLMLTGPQGMTPNARFGEVMGAAFPKNTPIVVGCKAGARSLRAAKQLLLAGYTNVLDQRAGWAGAHDPFGQVTEPGWVAAGLAIEEGHSEGYSPRARS